MRNVIAPSTITPVILMSGNPSDGYSPIGGSGGGISNRQYGAPTDSLITTNGDAGTIAPGGMAFIQNLDDAACYVKLGAGASASVFSFVLSAGSAANDGLGGSKDITNYTGLVTVFAATGAPRLIFSNFA